MKPREKEQVKKFLVWPETPLSRSGMFPSRWTNCVPRFNFAEKRICGAEDGICDLLPLFVYMRKESLYGTEIHLLTVPNKNDRTGISSRNGTPEGHLPAFFQEQGWHLISEFRFSKEDGHPMNEDPLLELCAGAEKDQFQILLFSELERFGRVPVECSASASFFERHGVEVRYGLQRIDMKENSSVRNPRNCDRFHPTIMFWCVDS